MKTLPRCIGMFLIVFSGVDPSAALADDVDFNLAAQQTHEETVEPGMRSIRFFNRVPKFSYQISIERRVQAVAAFSKPDIATTEAKGTTCRDQIEAVAKGLSDRESEDAVQEWLQKAPDKLDKCSKADRDGALAEFRNSCSFTQLIRLSAGEEVIVTLSRPGKSAGETVKWTVRLRTQPRGQWLTTYGVAIIPNRDEKYALQATATAGDFLIVAQEKRQGEIKFQPSVFFTWLSSKYALKDYAWGPTAGFGAGSDTYSLFVGFSALYNWNIQLSAGGSAFQVQRLAANHQAGEIVHEMLTDDQLHRKTGWLGWYAALTFRFGENPFKPTGSEAATKQTPKEKGVGGDEEDGAR